MPDVILELPVPVPELPERPEPVPEPVRPVVPLVAEPLSRVP